MHVYKQWKGLSNRKKARQRLMVCINKYIKGFLHPNDLPYFKSTPKHVDSEKTYLKLDANIKHKLNTKLTEDHIKTAQFFRALIEMLLISNETNLQEIHNHKN